MERRAQTRPPRQMAKRLQTLFPNPVITLDLYSGTLPKQLHAATF